MADELRADQHNDSPNRSRSTFLRDVLMLQVKLLIGNLHNFVLVPLSLGAAALDLVSATDEEGGRFYRVLAWGREADELIGLYRALDRDAEHGVGPASDKGPELEIKAEDSLPE